MIGRVLHTAWMGLVYFCVATLWAEAIMATYCWSAWGLNRDKVVRVLAVAQGIDLLAMKEESQRDDEPVAPEQVSYEQVLEARAVKVRDLELREDALGNAVAQLRSARETLAEQRRRQKEAEMAFEAQLAKMRDTAMVEGMENVRQTFGKIAPKQAKDLILQMLENHEMDAVVQLLGGMQEGKRAKIVGQFKSPEDLEEIGEVLRRIREGEPNTELAEKVRKELP